MRHIISHCAKTHAISVMSPLLITVTQVMVAKDHILRHKRTLCVDYSLTINQYTELDGYPLTLIEDMFITLAKHKVFSNFDLKSAYQQVPIKESDLKYTGFEANGRIYQFYCIPFGVTNGVAVFQRAMDMKMDSTLPFTIWTT